MSEMFEKMIFTNLYSFFSHNDMITKNQSGFRPSDSTTNQLLYLVNEIHEAFENPKCLEVRSVFLDISKAFDKVSLYSLPGEVLLFLFKLLFFSCKLSSFKFLTLFVPICR